MWEGKETMQEVPVNIQPYIDMGMFTVPLARITRQLKDERKIKFPKVPSGYFQTNRNNVAEVAGTAFTGKLSNFTVLDFDNKDLFDMARAIDPNCGYIVVSDIPEKGGHMGYRYSEVLPNRRMRGELDILNDGGQVFLATEGNETKKPIHVDLDNLTEVPPLIIKLCETLLAEKTLVNEKRTASLDTGFMIGPMLDKAISSKQYSPQLFYVLTPKLYRDDNYYRNKHKHPDDIPLGNGHDYLARVAAILASDISVSPLLFEKAMIYINNLWSEPMSPTELNKLYIERYISGNATNDEGQPFWRYDEFWESTGVRGVTKNGEGFEIFYDETRRTYYYIKSDTGEMSGFPKPSDLMAHIHVVTGIPITKDILHSRTEVISVLLDPQLSYGFDEERTYYNTYKPTEFIEKLRDTNLDGSRYPETIMKFLESLMPGEKERNYFLRFLKRKLTTFEYSPVIFIIIGKTGTGKDTLFRLLSKMVGVAYTMSPMVNDFLGDYTAWLMDKIFIQLDEFGENSTISEKKRITGKLKSFTGSDTYAVRAMRTDQFTQPMRATFVMTANDYPAVVSPDDRRVYAMYSPNKLKEQKWVQEIGGTAGLIKQLDKELLDFMAYLRDEVKPLSEHDYHNPDTTDMLKELVIHTGKLVETIPYMLKHGMYDKFYDMMVDKQLDLDMWKHKDKDYILVNDLERVYTDMSGNSGNLIVKAMKEAGFVKSKASVGGITNTPVYRLEKLSESNVGYSVGVRWEMSTPEVKNE